MTTRVVVPAFLGALDSLGQPRAPATHQPVVPMQAPQRQWPWESCSTAAPACRRSRAACRCCPRRLPLLFFWLPATSGWLFTYYNSKKTDERKAQIERINDQVRVRLSGCALGNRAADARQPSRAAARSVASSLCADSPPTLTPLTQLLYGPLLACVHASRSAYSAMVRQHSPDGTVQVRPACWGEEEAQRAGRHAASTPCRSCPAAAD